MSALLVLTNLPDRGAAERLADAVIASKLAACVNILAPCRSVYRWKGEVQHDEEAQAVVGQDPSLLRQPQRREPPACLQRSPVHATASPQTEPIPRARIPGVL